MDPLRDLLTDAATRAANYRARVADVPVFPSDADLDAVRAALGELADGPTPAATVIAQLADAVEPALVASAGPRYFGFVVGGALDAATAADMLTSGWDQTGFNAVSSPAAAIVEEVAGGWLNEILGLPRRRPSASPPVARPPTPSPWRPRVITCSPRPAGTSNGTGSPARPACGWSRTASGMSPSTAPCASWVSGPP